MRHRPRIKAIDRTVERLTRKYGLEQEDADMITHMLGSVCESRDRRINYLDQMLVKYQRTDYGEITKPKILGALKSTISAHGPITHEWTESAAKRIFGLIK